MSSTGKSVEKVHYEFRPAKQVERRMLLHLLHRLSEAVRIHRDRESGRTIQRWRTALFAVRAVCHS
jgi:hypothetical protein